MNCMVWFPTQAGLQALKMAECEGRTKASEMKQQVFEKYKHVFFRFHWMLGQISADTFTVTPFGQVWGISTHELTKAIWLAEEVRPQQSTAMLSQQSLCQVHIDQETLGDVSLQSLGRSNSVRFVKALECSAAFWHY